MHLLLPKMVKNYNHPDPADSEWTVVCYRNPAHTAEQVYARRARQHRLRLRLAEIATNPMNAYTLMKRNHEDAMRRRLSHDPKYSKLSPAECSAKVEEFIYNHSPMSDYLPTIITSNTAPQTSTRSAGVSRKRKIERTADEDGDYRVSTFNSGFLNDVVNKRAALGLTQKEVAGEVNLQESVIRDLEKGSLPYDPNVKAQLANWLASH